MSLSCYCDDGFEWYYRDPEDLAPLATKRGRRCCSCKAPLKVGEEVGHFLRWRMPQNDVEECIYGSGGEIPQTTWYMCETCVDLFWALRELDFCIMLPANMRSLVREYNDMRKAGHL